MASRRGSRLVPALVGLGLLTLSLGGCGWFSRAKPAVAPAPPPPPVAAPAPAPPPPPVVAPTPPTPAPRRPPAGRIADEEMLRVLVQGRSTKDEVRGLFGVPQEIILSPGVETFIYYRDKSSGWFSRTTERVEMLTIRFDMKGVLKDFEYRYSGK